MKKKFKIGDRVKIISGLPGCYGANGKTGVVVGDSLGATHGLYGIDSFDTCIVELDDGYRWRVAGEIELIKPKLTKHDVYVIVDTPEKYDQLLDVLDKAGEKVYYERRPERELREYINDKIAIDDEGDWYYYNKEYNKTEVTIEELAEILNVNMKTQTITREQLKAIYDVAYPEWKKKISDYASKDPFSNTIEFNDDEVEVMFKASSEEQKKVLIKSGLKLPEESKNVFKSDFSINQFERELEKVVGGSVMAITTVSTTDQFLVKKSFVVFPNYEVRLHEGNYGATIIEILKK